MTTKTLNIKLVKLEATRNHAHNIPLSLSFFYGQKDDGTGRLYQSLNDFYNTTRLGKEVNANG